MKLKILYLARLRDALGRAAEDLDMPTASSVSALVETLRERGEPWVRELASGRAVRVAVNQEMSGMSAVLGEGDEVAFFPPVTGG